MVIRRLVDEGEVEVEDKVAASLIRGAGETPAVPGDELESSFAASIAREAAIKNKHDKPSNKTPICSERENLARFISVSPRVNSQPESGG